jgi:tRNA(Ile)-lysidine synthase
VPKRPRLTPAIADLRRAVRESLKQANAQKGQVVLAAVSGGADSLAMAAALSFEAPKLNLEIAAVIVDHNLQKDSAEVAIKTKTVLEGLGYKKVRIVKVKVGKAGGPEAAARTARYEAINKTATSLKSTFVMLGHTLDDQAEQVLLGLARGSGAKSLSGMQKRNGIYLRPFLEIDRTSTEKFCEDSLLEPWFDPHNQDEKFLRVRVRQNIFPILEKELGPGIKDALVRSANQLREDDEFLESYASELFGKIARVSKNTIELEVSELKELSASIRNRLIKKSLDLLTKESSRQSVLAIAELVLNWHGQKALMLSGVRVERKGEIIALKATK